MNSGGKLRKFLRIAGIGVAVICGLGFVALPAIRESYSSRAVLTQRVQIDAAGASLFGDGATPIGSPQLMIIDAPKAIVGKPKDGVRQVDDAYLQKNHIYPLQLKTVDYTIAWIQKLLAAGIVIGALIAVVLRRKK